MKDKEVSIVSGIGSRAVRLTCGLALLLLSACGDLPGPTGAGQVDPSAALPGPPLRTRPEGLASAPCGPLWPEGERITVRGLYRTSGEQAYLDVQHLQPEGPPCWARFFLQPDPGRGGLDLGAVDWHDPGYVEVTGQLSSERWSSAGLWDLQVADGTVLPWEPAAVRAACLEAVLAQAVVLADLDWAALALPSYYTATVDFFPSPEQVAQFEVQLLGADEARPVVVATAEGAELPPWRPLVRRWVAVDCLYDLERGQVVELVATIRGEVQE